VRTHSQLAKFGPTEIDRARADYRLTTRRQLATVVARAMLALAALENGDVK
jgi:hypothetical protein